MFPKCSLFCTIKQKIGRFIVIVMRIQVPLSYQNQSHNFDFFFIFIAVFTSKYKLLMVLIFDLDSILKSIRFIFEYLIFVVPKSMIPASKSALLNFGLHNWKPTLIIVVHHDLSVHGMSCIVDRRTDKYGICPIFYLVHRNSSSYMTCNRNYQLVTDLSAWRSKSMLGD